MYNTAHVTFTIHTMTSLEVAPTIQHTQPNNKLHGCYLFTVSNSGLLLETVGQSMPGNVYPQPNKEHFSSCDREISPITVTSEHDLNPGQVKERNDCHITRHNVTLV